MCGVTSATTSPSVRNTSRNTPCVLGCCGPMLTSISSLCRSNSTSSGSTRSIAMRYLPRNPVVLGGHLIILAQRVADPVLGQEDPPQVGVARKKHARQVEHLALVPLGRAPDVADAGHLGQPALHVVLPARQHDLQHQPVPMDQAGEVIDRLPRAAASRAAAAFLASGSK